MGKPTGFLEFARETSTAISPKDRIKNFDEFHIPLPLEKQRQQGGRCMDCGVPFCQSGMMLFGMTSGCPLHNLVPEWNDCVYTGNLEEAYERLHKTNNFPEFTSRVCPALCEAACTCDLNGDPVSTKENEYTIIENAYEKGYAAPKPPKARTGKKIAVIGSGPSGLAAADQLNRRGHSVTVFERNDRIGGLLMYGIPNMKLDKRIVERKVEVMKAEGVEFVTGVNVGVDKKAAELLKEYDRVILACGAPIRETSRYREEKEKVSTLRWIFSQLPQRACSIPLSETNSSSRPKERKCWLSAAVTPAMTVWAHPSVWERLLSSSWK